MGAVEEIVERQSHHLVIPVILDVCIRICAIPLLRHLHSIKCDVMKITLSFIENEDEWMPYTTQRSEQGRYRVCNIQKSQGKRAILALAYESLTCLFKCDYQPNNRTTP